MESNSSLGRPSMGHVAHIGLLLLAFFSAVATADATLIHDSFGPGGQITDGPFAAWTELGTSINGTGQIWAGGFVPTSDYYFDSAELALGVPVGLNSVEVALAGDFIAAGSGYFYRGATLESFTLTGVVPPGPGVVSAPSATRPVLHSGQTYWILATTTDPGASANWYVSKHGITGLVAASRDDMQPYYGRFNEDAAALIFRVNGTEIPEPQQGLLLGTGLLCLVLLRLKLRTRC